MVEVNEHFFERSSREVEYNLKQDCRLWNYKTWRIGKSFDTGPKYIGHKFRFIDTQEYVEHFTHVKMHKSKFQMCNVQSSKQSLDAIEVLRTSNDSFLFCTSASG